MLFDDARCKLAGVVLQNAWMPNSLAPAYNWVSRRNTSTCFGIRWYFSNVSLSVPTNIALAAARHLLSPAPYHHPSANPAELHLDSLLICHLFAVPASSIVEAREPDALSNSQSLTLNNGDRQALPASHCLDVGKRLIESRQDEKSIENAGLGGV